MNALLLRRGLTAALSILLLCAAATTSSLAKDKDTVRIDRLAGTVEVMHATATKGKWLAAESEQELNPGWGLRTGKKSKVQLIFPKDNTLILRENSFLEIVELKPGGGARLKASEGGLLAQLKHDLEPGSEFTLETPSALAIVRGTEYGARIEETGEVKDGQPVTRTTFYGYDGTVEVTNEQGTQLLEARQTLSVVAGVAPDLPMASVVQAIEFLDDLTSEELFEEAERRLKDKAKQELNKRIPGIGGLF
jgi:hypothetical protein